MPTPISYSDQRANAPKTYNPSEAEQVKGRQSKDKSDISTMDFFKLLAAQLQNQNMLNPVNDTEFLAQMAQFSALSAMREMSGSVSNLIAVSYIGKTVTASQVNLSGESTTVQGVAEKVDFLNGETYITVDGIRFKPEQITQISIT